MASGAIVFGVLTVLNNAVPHLKSLKERYKNFKKARGKLDEIEEKFKTCNVSLTSLTRLLERGLPTGFPPESMSICETMLTTINDLAKSCEKQVKDLKTKEFSNNPSTVSWMNPILKARLAAEIKGVMQGLDKLDADLKHIDEVCRELNGQLGPAHQRANFAPGHPETFTPRFVIPRPSDFDVLDFSSKETPEGELKHLLLSDNPGSEQVVAAWGGVIHGMGGVGKTSALIGLGYDYDIRAHFSDGVHFLTFGQFAQSSEVIKHMGRIVRVSGGFLSATVIESCSNLNEAVHKAGEWFAGRTCLFLCDDLWRKDQHRLGFLPDIMHLLDTSSSSRMIISTRDRNIAEHSTKPVVFKPKTFEGEESRCIFLRHAGLSLTASHEYGDEAESLVQKILRICGGMPITLAVAGKLCRRNYRRSPNDPINALKVCLGNLTSKDITVGDMPFGDTPVGVYSSFNSTISASLNCLENDPLTNVLSVSKRNTIHTLFEALCVIKNQARFPISILQRLWDLSRDKSVRLMDSLADLSIVSYISENSISAHDLVLAYTQNMARGSRRKEIWHKKLLNGYMRLASESDDSGYVEFLPEPSQTGDHVQKSSDLSFQSPRAWWDVESDGYIHKNLGWHLVNGGLVSELRSLATDVRWTKFRLKHGGFPELENDMDMLLAVLGDGDVAQGEENQRKYIRILQQALRFVWSKDPPEFGFNLYRRLCRHRDSSDIVRHFLNSMEKWHERPWLRPWHSPMAAEDERIVMEMNVRTSENVAWSPDETHILYSDAETVVAYNVIRNEQSFCFECSAYVMSISCAEDVGIVAVGTSEGVILLWNLETKSQFGESLVTHSPQSHIAISGDGRVLISGSRDKAVRLWHLDDGKVIRKHRRKCRRKWRHDFVSVSISGNGERAVSLFGKTITVWKTADMSPVHTFQAQGRSVWTIALSEDGENLVAAGRSIEVWNLYSQVCHFLCKDVVVYGVSISRNSMRVAASFMYSDWDTRVWDLSTQEQIGTPLRRPLKKNQAVALNGNGNRLVLASYNDISVWNVSDEAEEQDGVRAYCTAVRCVTYCHETETIASVSMRGKVRLWDSATGLQRGEPIPLSYDIQRPYALVMSGNGKKIAIAARGWSVFPTRICVWDVRTRMEIGKIELGRLTGHFHLWISRDGRRLAAKASHDDGGEVQVWDAITLTEIVPPPEAILNAVENDAAAKRDRSSVSLGVEGSLKLIQGHELVLENQGVRTVLGFVGEHICPEGLIVYRGAQDEQIAVMGGSSGRLYWFTIEM